LSQVRLPHLPHLPHQSQLPHFVLISAIGGASGIGLALVQFFASYCCKIALLDISPESAAHVQAVLSSLRTQYPASTFIFQKCDVSSWEEQAAAFKTFYNETGGIDIVCANAGIVEAGKFLEKDQGEPRKPNLKTLDVDLNGILFCESILSFHQVIIRLGLETDTQSSD
jgi:NAD(P)-dependent dehydrogenase (short-subunit alcohol dehydrogenase family)